MVGYNGHMLSGKLHVHVLYMHIYMFYFVVCQTCVQTKSRTTGYEAAYELYQQLQCYKGRKNNVAILLKRLRSRHIVKTSEKANMPSPSINGGHAYNN